MSTCYIHVMERLVVWIDGVGQFGIEHLGARVRALIDLHCIVALTQVDLWLWPDPTARWPLAVLNVAAVPFLLGTWRRLAPARQELYEPSAGWTAWSAVGGATLILAAALLLAAALTGSLEPEFELAALGKPPAKIPLWVLRKGVACAAQELLLLWVLFPLAFVACGRRWPALGVSAVLFGLSHVPNEVLVGTTSVMALVWLWQYPRHRGLLPIILGHLFLAVLLRFALPSHVHLDLNVGARAVGEQREITWLHEQALWPRVEQYASRAYFESTGGTEAGFIHGLYRDILGRDESLEENTTWQQARGHHTRLDVVIDFFTSHEYSDRHGLSHPYSRG